MSYPSFLLPVWPVSPAAASPCGTPLQSRPLRFGHNNFAERLPWHPSISPGGLHCNTVATNLPATIPGSLWSLADCLGKAASYTVRSNQPSEFPFKRLPLASRSHLHPLYCLACMVRSQHTSTIYRHSADVGRMAAKEAMLLYNTSSKNIQSNQHFQQPLYAFECTVQE